jgi:hypothetical protein
MAVEHPQSHSQIKHVDKREREYKVAISKKVDLNVST